MTPLPNDHELKVPLSKVADAKRTLKELSQYLDEYRRSGACSFTENHDSSRNTVQFDIGIHEMPDERFIAPRMRLVVHDLRSALDNTVFILSERNGLEAAGVRKPSFPIVAKGGSPLKTGDRRIEALTKEQIERVVNLQPYSQHPPLNPNPLIVLDELSRTDKHRDGSWLGFSPGFIREPYAIAEFENFLSGGEDVAPVDDLMQEVVDRMRINPGPLEDGDWVFRMWLPDQIDLDSFSLRRFDLPLGVDVYQTLHSDTEVARPLPLERGIHGLVRYVQLAILYIDGQTPYPPMPVSTLVPEELPQPS